MSLHAPGKRVQHESYVDDKFDIDSYFSTLRVVRRRQFDIDSYPRLTISNGVYAKRFQIADRGRFEVRADDAASFAPPSLSLSSGAGRE